MRLRKECDVDRRFVRSSLTSFERPVSSLSSICTRTSSGTSMRRMSTRPSWSYVRMRDARRGLCTLLPMESSCSLFVGITVIWHIRRRRVYIYTSSTTKKTRECLKDVEDRDQGGRRARSQERTCGDRWTRVLARANCSRTTTVSRRCVLRTNSRR